MNIQLEQTPLVDCLKTVSDFGQNKIINICTGEVNIIPWGSVDWLLAIILITFGIGFTLICIIGLFKIILDY